MPLLIDHFAAPRDAGIITLCLISAIRRIGSLPKYFAVMLVMIFLNYLQKSNEILAPVFEICTSTNHGDKMIYLVSPATCALVLNQTTENFQEKSSLVVYKSKLNNTGMDQCFLKFAC